MMDLKDTMHTIVYGEIIFTETTADIQRIVGFLEVPASWTGEVLDMIDKMGYDWICLQQATHLEYVCFCGDRYSLGDLYKGIKSKLSNVHSACVQFVE